jgi:UDP-glucose 4-epimerase
MKCIVLGGGGFIGSAVVDQLLIEGHSVRGFAHERTKPYRGFSDKESVEWVVGDFLVKSDVRSAIDGADVVIHLISTTLPKSSNENPAYDVQTNLLSTLSLLDIMIEAKIKKIIFVSSGGTVYGRPHTIPITEEHVTNPLVSYGITKLAIEKYLLLYKELHGLQPIILRVSNPFGHRQAITKQQGAVSIFIDKALKGETIEIWGDGSVTRDFIHIDDLARAFVLAVEYEGEKNLFNIGSGRGTTLNELVDTLENILGTPIKRRYVESRNFDAPLSVLDIALASRELGWKPDTSLGNGIRRTLTALQNSNAHNNARKKEKV